MALNCLKSTYDNWNDWNHLYLPTEVLAHYLIYWILLKSDSSVISVNDLAEISKFYWNQCDSLSLKCTEISDLSAFKCISVVNGFPDAPVQFLVLQFHTFSELLA